MPAKPRSYGDAVTQALKDIGAARIADPDEHFPYKADVVHKMLDKDAPLGPTGPKDNSVTMQDVMSRRIADASEALVEAQRRHLENPESRPLKVAYEAAKDDLVAARRAHRRARVDADGNPTSAILGITRAELGDHYVGPRLRRVGEE